MEGTPFGRYRLVELLSRGGMSEVWRADDPTMNRVIALKVLPPNLGMVALVAALAIVAAAAVVAVISPAPTGVSHH